SDSLKVVDFAGSAAAGGNAGVGLGLDVGIFSRDVEAFAGKSASITAYVPGIGINISASSPETLTSLAAAAGLGRQAGIAGSISVYVPHTTTKAFFDASASATVDAITLSATDAQTISLIAGSAGAGGDAGVGIANTTLVKNDDVEATIGSGAQIISGGGGLSL